MKKYIFLTREGFTSSPTNIPSKNMQVVGIIDKVNNEDEALKQLLKENPWIWDSGFNVAEFIAYEIVS